MGNVVSQEEGSSKVMDWASLSAVRSQRECTVAQRSITRGKERKKKCTGNPLSVVDIGTRLTRMFFNP